jgi:hypothetical protein
MDETLRLYPPVPLDIKQSIHDDTLPCGAFVPGNTLVVWSAYLMGRNEQVSARLCVFVCARVYAITDARHSYGAAMCSHSCPSAGSMQRTQCLPINRYHSKRDRGTVCVCACACDRRCLSACDTQHLSRHELRVS